jgi:hypothetical protein
MTLMPLLITQSAQRAERLRVKCVAPDGRVVQCDGCLVLIGAGELSFQIMVQLRQLIVRSGKGPR